MIYISEGLYFDPALGLILQLQGTEGELPKHIQLDAKLAGLFHLLLQKQGELVTRNSFIQEVWEGNKWVGEKALTRNISRLRMLLREYRLEQKCQIKTFPKKGYSLIINTGQSRPSMLTAWPSPMKRIISISLCLAIVMTGLFSIFSSEVVDVEEYRLILQDEEDVPVFEDMVQQE